MIITNNEEALRVICSDVTLEEVGPLVEQLEKELARSERLGRPGIGLAAPQIGIAKKIAIVRFKDYSFNLVNAKITNKYDPKIFIDEGCLSFPGRIENTLRYQEVHIENNLIYPNRFIATGLLSVVCQHELDHVESKLFFDSTAPRQKPIVNSVKLGVNEPCFCGSGIKYKRCCLRK